MAPSSILIEIEQKRFDYFTILEIDLQRLHPIKTAMYVPSTAKILSGALPRAYLQFMVRHSDPSGRMEAPNLITALLRQTPFHHVPPTPLMEGMRAPIRFQRTARIGLQVISWALAPSESLGDVALQTIAFYGIGVSVAHVADPLRVPH